MSLSQDGRGAVECEDHCKYESPADWQYDAGCKDCSKIVVTRTGQENKHEHVYSSGYSWNKQMRRPLQIRRYGSLAVRLRLQRLWTIVVSRIRLSKQHEHVSSPGWSWNSCSRKSLQSTPQVAKIADNRCQSNTSKQEARSCLFFRVVAEQLDAKTIAKTKVRQFGNTSQVAKIVDNCC